MCRYITDPDEAKLIRSCFAGIYPLDESEAGKKAVAMALEKPELYVMKPQREGGGEYYIVKTIRLLAIISTMYQFIA